MNLSEILLPERTAGASSQASGKPSGKYSAEDIDELLQKNVANAVKKHKDKESRRSEPVSQDLLDSMFDSSGKE